MNEFIQCIFGKTALSGSVTALQYIQDTNVSQQKHDPNTSNTEYKRGIWTFAGVSGCIVNITHL